MYFIYRETNDGTYLIQDTRVISLQDLVSSGHVPNTLGLPTKDIPVTRSLPQFRLG